jgi:hypothetical protein
MQPMLWEPLRLQLESFDEQHSGLLDQLARGELPAVVFAGAYSANDCRRLIDRLLERRLMYDPAGPTPEEFQAQTIPEGYYRRGDQLEQSRAAPGATANGHRIDVGTSLGYRGTDRVAYFAHAAETQRLFAGLFDGLRNPIKLLYNALQRLAPSQHVITAAEPDGAQYGPAIFRIHYGDYSYPPHFDSVRLREVREGYAVYRYEHQFAAVLILQNAVAADATAQCIIHRCPWMPELDAVLRDGRFHQFAREHQLASCRVELEPGDLYVFNTRYIHEVPGVAGQLPRVVLAAFLGYSAHDPQMMVWG